MNGSTKTPRVKIETPGQYYVWVDFVRAVAIFGVVLIHAAAQSVMSFDTIPRLDWWMANIADSAARSAVPLFFMLTGYLLLGKRETLITYGKKRFSKIIFPWVSWSIIYLFWKSLYEHQPLTLGQAVEAFRGGDVYFHLWFMYVLTALYVLIPLLRILTRRCTRADLVLLLLLWFLWVAVLPLTQKTINFFSDKSITSIHLSAVLGHSGYLLLGHFLGRWPVPQRIAQIAVSVYVVCAAATAIATHVFSAFSGEYFPYFYSYLSPNVILMSVAAFICLKYWGINIVWRSAFINFLKVLNPLSLGIYLIHPIILTLLRDGGLGVTLNVQPNHTIYMLPLLTIIVFLLSLYLAKFLTAVPILRRII